MQPDSTPSAYDQARQAGYEHRMKKYRTTALIVFACVFGLEMLHSHPRPPTSGMSPVAQRSSASARPTALRRADLSAFRLGKMIADYSALLQLRRQNRVHAGDTQRLQALGIQLQAALRLLNVPVKIEQLDFDWQTSNLMAPAGDLLTQSLASQYDPHTSVLYQLGVQLMAARWRASSFQDTLVLSAAATDTTAPGSGADNPGTVNDRQAIPATRAILATLHAKTTEAIGKFDLARFQPSVAVTDLLHTPDIATESLLLQIYSLDLAAETLLAQ